MLNDWRNWCRLCGHQEAIVKLEDTRTFLEIIKKFFMVSVSSMDTSTLPICRTCCDFINKLEEFSNHVILIDKMYKDLFMASFNNLEINVHEIRKKYNLETENEQILEKSEEFSEVEYLTDTNEIRQSNNLTLEQIPGIKCEAEQNLYSVSQAVKKRRRQKRSNFQEEIQIKVEDDLVECLLSSNPTQYTAEAHETDTEQADDQIGSDSETDEEEDGNYQPCDKQKGASKHHCEKCNKFYSRRQTLEEHIRLKHSGDKEMRYECSNCQKKFFSEKKLKQHSYSHLPPDEKMVHPCPYCDKKFTKSVNVQAHVRAIHIGERPFICEECGKSFQTKGALKDHQITHSEDRPFSCKHCSKNFKNLARLKTHEDIHNNTSYVCPHCGLQLNTKRTLKMHMVVHSDEKRYKCNYCGNEYKRSKALKNHLILHTGLRPYSCPFCEKTFANGSNCRSHKKKAHPAELAALEASGEQPRTATIPRLEILQPKTLPSYSQITDMNLADIEDTTIPTIIEQPMQLTSSNATQILQTARNIDISQATTVTIQESPLTVHVASPQHVLAQQSTIQLPTIQVPVTMLSLVRTTAANFK